MKKPVNMVYKSTTDCTSKMEIINSIIAYLRRCDKASDKGDKVTLRKCCKEAELLINRVSKMALNEIQIDRVDKYRERIEKYKAEVN